MSPMDLRKRISRITLHFLFPILSILILIALFGFEFLSQFQLAQYVIGFDSPTHMAMIDVYRADIFPSLWGWVPNWYTGMPLPLFYPPLAYYLGGLLLPLFDTSLGAYKLLSYLSVTLPVIVTYIILKKIFAKDIDAYIPATRSSAHDIQMPRFFSHTILTTFRKYVPLIISIVLVFTLNPGAPSVQAIANGILSNQFSVIFLLITIYCLLNKKPVHLIGAILGVALTIVSNAHTFLAGTTLLFFFCILFPFAFEKGSRIKKFFVHTSKITFIYVWAILIASFWVVPMLYYYRYFTGTHTVSLDQSTKFFTFCGTAVVVSFLGIFIAHYEGRKVLRQLYLALFTTFLLLFGIEIYQRVSTGHLLLPVQLWRWYETMFYISVIPICHVLYFAMHRIKYITICILLILSIVTVFRQVNIYGMDAHYTADHIDGLIQQVTSYIPKQDIFVTFSEEVPKMPIFRQTLIDASIGAQNKSVVFSNLRESSINAIFLRIAKTMVSKREEAWALVNYAQSNILQKNNLEAQSKLLDFVGFKHILLSREVSTSTWGIIDFDKIKSYSIKKLTPDFSLLTSKKDISRASQFEGPLTLIFAQDGFRDRTRFEPTYTRFQETTYEKKLFEKTISFLPNTPIFEQNTKEVLASKYIILADLQTKDNTQTVALIREALKNPTRKIFILEKVSNTSEKQLLTIKLLKQTFPHHPQIQYVYPRTESYPFDDIADTIRKNEKNNIKEIPLPVQFPQPNMVHIDIPATSTAKTLASTLSSTRIIFLRQSYFPAWKAIDQTNHLQTTYLASPGYTMIMADNQNSISLYFSTPHIVLISHKASLAGLALVGIIACVFYIRGLFRIRRRLS